MLTEGYRKLWPQRLVCNVFIWCRVQSHGKNSSSSLILVSAIRKQLRAFSTRLSKCVFLQGHLLLTDSTKKEKHRLDAGWWSSTNKALHNLPPELCSLISFSYFTLRLSSWLVLYHFSKRTKCASQRELTVMNNKTTIQLRSTG